MFYGLINIYRKKNTGRLRAFFHGCPVFVRRTGEFSFKKKDEIRKRLESGVLCNLGNRFVCTAQLFSRKFQTVIIEILHETAACILSENFHETAWRKTCIFCSIPDANLFKEIFLYERKSFFKSFRFCLGRFSRIRNHGFISYDIKNFKKPCLYKKRTFNFILFPKRSQVFYERKQSFVQPALFFQMI